MTEIHDLPADAASDLLRRMTLIRLFEERVSEMFLRGHIPGTIHLSLGQEAVPVGVTAAMEEEDILIPTHRGHGHALAKGMSPTSLFAELFARQMGCSQAKGGSLHIADVSKGIMPANPVVGSSVPVAAGIAFSFRYRQQRRVVASFFGDGAVNTGPLHEGINLAAIWDLPVIFICENNQYAISTHVSRITRLDRLIERAEAYGLPGVQVDGNDVLAIQSAAERAVERARAGDGPTFIECLTYRMSGHKRDDSAPYRSQDEVERWRERDPIERFKVQLTEKGVLTADQIQSLVEEVNAEIDEAVEEALAAPPPDPAQVLEDVYA